MIVETRCCTACGQRKALDKFFRSYGVYSGRCLECATGTILVQGANTASTGALAELVVASDFLSRGYFVFRALSPGSPFDLVVYKNGRLSRIEVKTLRCTPNGTKRYTRPTNIEWDILAHFCPETGELEYEDKTEEDQ